MRMTSFGPTQAPLIAFCFPDLKTQKRRYRRLKLLKLTKNKGFPPLQLIFSSHSRSKLTDIGGLCFSRKILRPTLGILYNVTHKCKTYLPWGLMLIVSGKETIVIWEMGLWICLHVVIFVKLIEVRKPMHCECATSYSVLKYWTMWVKREMPLFSALCVCFFIYLSC